MNIKKWNILFFTSILLLYCFSVLLHYAVNPYMLFDNSITDKKFYFTKAYSKKQFEALKHDKYTLVFGHSRIARISSDMLNEKVLNLENIYHKRQDSVYNFLIQLSPIQINNINNIYYILDVGHQDHTNKEFIDYNTVDYKQNILDIFLINSAKIKAAINDIIYNYIKHPDYYVHKDGSNIPYLHKTTFQTSAVFDTKKQAYSKSGLSEIIKVNNFSLKNNIKTTYFTATLIDLMFKKMNLDIEKDKLKYLLDNGLLGFYGLLYIDGISNLKNGNNYLAFSDASHLNAKYLKKKLFDNIINSNKYFISNSGQLDIYIEQLRKIQTTIP